MRLRRLDFDAVRCGCRSVGGFDAEFGFVLWLWVWFMIRFCYVDLARAVCDWLLKLVSVMAVCACDCVREKQRKKWLWWIVRLCWAIGVLKGLLWTCDMVWSIGTVGFEKLLCDETMKLTLCYCVNSPPVREFSGLWVVNFGLYVFYDEDWPPL